jgi:hypothetical protein
VLDHTQLSRGVLPVDLLVKCTCELLDELRLHQPPLEVLQDEPTRRPLARG